MNVIERLNTNGIFKGVVIGSRAYPDFVTEKSDIDIIVKECDIPSHYDITNKDILSMDGGLIEVHILRDTYTLNAVYESSYSADDTGNDIIYANILTLYALKCGHIHRKLIKWDSHMYHYTVLRDACIDTYGEDFENEFIGFITLKNLIGYTKKHNEMIHGKEFNVPLNVTKDEFFTDGVTKFIEHDYLHEVFAHYDKPIYTMLQNTEQETVFCHMSLWDNLTYEDKCKCVLEESYVIASERFIIPAMVKDTSYAIDTLNPCQYVVEALKMVCTTLTSGYFRKFATENYYTIISMVDFKYYEKLVPVLKDYYNEVENENDIR